MRWNQDMVTRDNHRAARLGVLLTELCKSWTKKEENTKLDCLCIKRQDHHGFEGGDNERRLQLHIYHAGGVLGISPCLPAQDLDGCKILWNCCGCLCSSRKLKIQCVWHLFFLTSNTFQARILGWKQVDLEVSIWCCCILIAACTLIQSWHWNTGVWKYGRGKKWTTFDSIVKELHCFWRLPDACTCFEVRATRFFPVSMTELMCQEKYRDSVSPVLSLVETQGWMSTIIFLTLIFLEASPLFTVFWNKIFLPPYSDYKESDFCSSFITCIWSTITLSPAWKLSSFEYSSRLPLKTLQTWYFWISWEQWSCSSDPLKYVDIKTPESVILHLCKIISY